MWKGIDKVARARYSDSAAKAGAGFTSRWRQAGPRWLIMALAILALFIPSPPSRVGAFAESVDMSSAGAPTLSGNLGGSITGANDLVSNLQVTVNFGELSPINPNAVVVAAVPIGLRSTGSYTLNISVSGFSSGDANSVQLSDIGVGLQNLRPLGNKASNCGGNSVITPTFNNNPATSYSIAANGRALFPASLGNVGANTVLMSGPQLSKNGAFTPRSNNGYAIDLILAVVPQFFSSGNFTVTVNLQIIATCNNCGC